MSLLSCVIGAAGHIDHGKTRLIEALAGASLDRLKEEKRRGITIDIGFAKLELPGGASVGVVDVPGHQRFVHNMVAGAAGIDVALLVVAADDGVMPQTVEHLAIMETLGAPRGVVALTKIDLVDEETLELALVDVAELIEKSSLKGARIIPCSSVTGEGLEELAAELERLALATPPKNTDAFFRLPIDRVFTIKGHGVVVTGTVLSGRAKVDDRLVIVPGGLKGRVRGIQNHGEPAQNAAAGVRTALNLAGPEKARISRGMTVVDAAIATESAIFTASLSCHRSSPFTIAHGRTYMLHINTAETLCRVYLASDKSLKPGESAVAQVRFGEPLNILHGDRFILRSSSASHTLGGGVVLEPGGGPMGRRGLKSKMKKWEELKNLETGVAAFVGQKPWGRPLKEITAVFNLPEMRIDSILEKNGGIRTFELKGERLAYTIAEEKRLVELVAGEVKMFHGKHPSLAGVEESYLVKTAMRGMDEAVAARWVRRVEGLGRIEREGSIVKLPGRAAAFIGADEEARRKILAIFEENGLNPPKTGALEKLTGMKRDETAKMIRALVQAGDLVYIAPGFALSRETLEKAKKALMDEIERAGHVETGRYRDLLGAGRKTAIELLEHFDAQGLTKRTDDKGRRVLAGRPRRG
ncbi:MAG: selenocysteine-specific translation elongation factor [Candidatus Nitrospinota bacterium M3_3B_026]